MIDLPKSPTYVDDRGRTVIGERPPPHVARLRAALDAVTPDGQVTVTYADLCKLMDDLGSARNLAHLYKLDSDEVRALLAADAQWRTRADDEPTRSIVAVLLSAVKRDELRPEETPLQLAKRVVELVSQLRGLLRREYARQTKFVTDKYGHMAIADVRADVEERWIP